MHISQAIKRFRDWNERLSLKIYDALFISDKDAINAFSKYPYAWLTLLIPIAGIVGFYSIVWEENMNRRSLELEQRRLKLDKKS
jgi:hypothetical protein